MRNLKSALLGAGILASVGALSAAMAGIERKIENNVGPGLEGLHQAFDEKSTVNGRDFRLNCHFNGGYAEALNYGCR